MYSTEGQILDVGDVKSYLEMKKKECKGWGFDDITGGVVNFHDKEMYYELKEWFEKKYKE